MSKAVSQLFLCFALSLIVVSGACSHKPAYSEIDSNRTSRNQNAETQTGSPQPAAGETPPVAASQTGSAQAEAVRPAPPSFMTPAGTIKDLPSYPRAARVNVQIGPMQQAMMMTLMLHTRDSMEKVQAFYTQAIKENHWTVTDKLLDPELSEWTLNKDERNNAKVQVKKDPKTGSLDIAIVRTEKIETPK